MQSFRGQKEHAAYLSAVMAPENAPSLADRRETVYHHSFAVESRHYASGDGDLAPASCLLRPGGRALRYDTLICTSGFKYISK